MGIPSFFYPTVSRMAAIVLVLAGGLKTQELLSGLAMSWPMIFLTAFEVLFGVWLLLGLYPRWTRLLALACFAAFLNAAFLKGLQRQPSCGCFGTAPVQPWFAVALDALMVGGLLLSPPFSAAGETVLRAARLRWFAFFVSAFLVLLALGRPVAWKLELGAKHIPTLAIAETPAGIDEAALERVIQGVERNHAELHTLIYTTEQNWTIHPQKRPLGTLTKKVGKQFVSNTETVIEPKEEEHTRRVLKTWIRGEEVRYEDLPASEGGMAGSLLVISKGKYVQYSSRLRQAWLSTTSFPDADGLISIDLRRAGFQPPLRSIADWLRRCQVVNVGSAKDRAEREAVRVRARMKIHAITRLIWDGVAANWCEVTADFVPALNYLPSHVVHQYLPDGGVSSVTDIDYQQIGPQGAWFPRTITRRYCNRNSTSDPDAATGQCQSFQETVKVLAFGQGVHDEDFDPLLPPKTLVTGYLALKFGMKTGDVPVRASQITRKEPPPTVQPPTVQPLDVSKVDRVLPSPPPPKSVWPFAVGMDVHLLGICLVFRKRKAPIISAPGPIGTIATSCISGASIRAEHISCSPMVPFAS
jgi:hypothetical protein